jgi:hypothetical protein
LAICSHRSRHCVSTGMALCAALRIVAVRMRMRFPGGAVRS